MTRAAATLAILSFFFAGAVISTPTQGCTLSYDFNPFRPTFPPLDYTNARQVIHAVIPAPIVEVKRIQRGRIPDRDSCSDVGAFELGIKLPPGSDYAIEKLGIYLRPIQGQSFFRNRVYDGQGWREIPFFPTTPITGRIVSNEALISFSWYDSHPDKQKPLDLKLEAFFINESLAASPNTIFAVKQ